MTPYYADDHATLHPGDALEVMPGLDAGSAHSIVTDPPYGLGFMGKAWDHGVPGAAFWTEALRVARPGAFLLAFGGTRTFHRLAVAIEDAGWELRDTIMYVYGSGFPKSHDVAKAIDRAAGKEREIIGPNPTYRKDQEHAPSFTLQRNPYITAPATPDAERWQGWGTAVKPAWEPILVARKPFPGTVAANVLAHETGALNIDGCRVSVPEDDRKGKGGGCAWEPKSNYTRDNGSCRVGGRSGDPRDGKGRFPANLIHDGSPEVLALFPETGKSTGGGGFQAAGHSTKGGIYGTHGDRDQPRNVGIGDEGSAARFFYCTKAGKKERWIYCAACERAAPATDRALHRHGRPDWSHVFAHPTVKPLSLMRYLVRLVTAPGGTVFDPFMGTASTGKAAILEGMRFVGIDQDARACEIARRRLQHTERRLAL